MITKSGLCWLLPEALYRAAGLAESVQDPRNTTPSEEHAPPWPVLDGPASRRLDASLRSILPLNLTCSRREDYGDSRAAVAAAVRYRGPDGGSVTVVQRHLAHPLLLDAFCDPTRGGTVQVLPAGSAAIRTDDANTDAHRLVLVGRDGTFFVIDSVGFPSSEIPAPVTPSQLDELETDLDLALVPHRDTTRSPTTCGVTRE